MAHSLGTSLQTVSLRLKPRFACFRQEHTCLNMARVDSKNVKCHLVVCGNISTAILPHLTVCENISIRILPCSRNLVVCGNISTNSITQKRQGRNPAHFKANIQIKDFFQARMPSPENLSFSKHLHRLISQH